ncbi:hypothetical protein F8M41_000613 [Gigaspora margarita]|uniref:Uncharacterized protein n=1 Tax=Gigaspora margarita TaxID=4874 RepID=A0A8H3XFV3_GIGMA|nr:hypothetical protein F8M41_000613 [Gigaspora margarita]
MVSKNKNIWKPSSRSSTYIGGSKRTQRRKKVELKKAAQYIQFITTYFASALIYESSTELYVSKEVKSIELELESVNMESVESLEVESLELLELLEVESVELLEVESTVDVLAEKDIDKKTKIRLAIEELDGMLKTDVNKIDKSVRVCLQVSLQYLWLRY